MGPTAYANTKMDSIICVSMPGSVLKSLAIWGSAGAIIDEARGEMKVNEAVTMVAAHFFLFGHPLGLRGSVGPVKSTWTTLAQHYLSNTSTYLE
jgi:hypothetical protein